MEHDDIASARLEFFCQGWRHGLFLRWDVYTAPILFTNVNGYNEFDF